MYTGTGKKLVVSAPVSENVMCILCLLMMQERKALVPTSARIVLTVAGVHNLVKATIYIYI